jgi:hypothetical protein
MAETEVGISVVTLIELAHGAARGDTPERKAKRQKFIEELLTAIPLIPSRCLWLYAPDKSTARTKRGESEFLFPICSSA